MIRVVLVEDEALARAKLRRILAREPDVTIVGEAADGAQALERIAALTPDLVFMDIDLPDRSGLEVVRELQAEPWPLIVFATAYDAFAVQAFETRAIDYVLKPFDEDRLRETLARVRERRRERPLVAKDVRLALEVLAERQRELERRLDTRSPGLDRVLVRIGEEMRLVPVASIEWLRAADNYVELHVGRECHLVRETLGRLEQRLDPARFRRIHRGVIVCLDHVRAIRPTATGELEVVLLDGTVLPVSRSYRDRLMERGERAERVDGER